MIRSIRVPAAVLATSLLLAGCGSDTGSAMDHVIGSSPEPGNTTSHEARTTPAPEVSAQTTPQQVPGLGPKTWAKVPSTARQVVVVTGRGRNSSASTVVLYQRTASGWRAGASWPAHNAAKGWSDHHRAGDLRSPVGVYALTDAGGLLPDPGTRFPYDHGRAFAAVGTGFQGEPLTGSFDYVIAINYNRRAGTTPLDWTRPLGAARGGGIWLHVDHGGPTHGCVSVARAHMKALLRTLDPHRSPVVVMGDSDSLRR